MVNSIGIDMKALYSAVGVLVLMSACAELQGQENDWLIVPNVQVGPIRASSTEASLKETFGKKSIQSLRGGGDYRTDSVVTLVYADDTSRAIGLSWRDNKKLRYPERIWLCFGFTDVPGQWRTASGIRCNTTLRELEVINGGPFTMSGYGRDGAGTVTSWQGGRLDSELGPKGAIEIALGPKDRYFMEKLTPLERQTLHEVREISSSDSLMQRLNPVVGKIVFSFPK